MADTCHVSRFSRTTSTRRDWTRVEKDCRNAIQLDNHSIKAHYMLGLALVQRQKYKEGVLELEKALDHGRGMNPESDMMEEIWQELSKAKNQEWEHESNSRSLALPGLNLKRACLKALKDKLKIDATMAEGFTGEALVFHAAEQLEALELMFEKAAEDDTPSQLPDYLCCKITLDLIRDPVIPPSGFTYERSAILEHLQTVVKFEPITRERICPSK